MFSRRIVIDESRINRPINSIRSNCYTLFLQHNSTLTFSVFRILTLRVMHNLSTVYLSLLLNRNILNSFNSTFDGYHFDFLFRYYLFVVLFYVLDCVVICGYYFSGYLFYNFSLFIFNDFPFNWNSFYILPLFILCYFLLIRHICYTALT